MSEKSVTIDAKDKPLGRLASEIAKVLQGKHDPSYDPRLEGDTEVVVENVKDLKLTGSKAEQKVYRSHPTQRAGRLKTRSFEKVFEKDPAWVVKHAVSGMLPKNRLRKRRLKRLKVLIENNSEDNKEN